MPGSLRRTLRWSSPNAQLCAHASRPAKTQGKAKHAACFMSRRKTSMQFVIRNAEAGHTVPGYLRNTSRMHGHQQGYGALAQILGRLHKVQHARQECCRTANFAFPAFKQSQTVTALGLEEERVPYGLRTRTLHWPGSTEALMSLGLYTQVAVS